eukprot:gnl/MRDRNA2_/MRDRNA2_61929_c0_seq2.p1 gnl/MRDRNA2_/MRDRNA2_61929_c0~~gnl/MRDRNA2_/MRDRNA2_61929_c0_seq2.p1  ORF type:complete len:905 (+),score=115.22 gnl/MRDRNA2_/MRDRNA2_61929_c0_seq2:66-2717(+)
MELAGVAAELGHDQPSLEREASSWCESKFGFHRVFTWVPTVWGEENVDIPDAVVAKEYGVPRIVLMKKIQDEMNREAAFMKLPWTFFLCFVFASCFFGHDRTNELRGIEEALANDLHENAVFAYSDPGNMAHKEMDDAQYPADIFSWLRVGLVPLIFKKDKGWSELHPGSSPWPDVSLTDAQKKSYLQYNRVVGGVRLSQTRTNLFECENQELAEAYGMQCHSVSSAVAGLDLSVQPQHLDIRFHKADFEPHLTRWLLLDEGKENVEVRLRQIETANWISDRTGQVAVHFLTYNAHFNCLTLNGIHFFFSPTGRLWKKTSHTGIFLQPYPASHWWLRYADIVFVLLGARLFLIEITELSNSLNKHRKDDDTVTKCIKRYIIDFWNFVDWISIALMMAMTIMVALIFDEIDMLEEDLMNVSGLNPVDSSDINSIRVSTISFRSTEAYLNNLMDQGNHVFDMEHQCRIVASVFPICLMLRLFKVFSAQPRLALVTDTISVALVDVAHFLVVFVSIFSTFVLMAVSLFGREMPEFSTFGRSFNTCFAVLMGEFEHGVLFAEAREFGSVWFWLFQVIMAMLLLNMLLAIIMDTYSEVKGMSSNAETVADTIFNMLQRWHRILLRERLPLNDILNKMEEVYSEAWVKGSINFTIETKWSSNDLITVQEFFEKIFVPLLKGEKMEVSQAHRLITLAVRNWRLRHSEPLSLSEAMTVVGMTHQRQIQQDKTLVHLEHKLAHTNSMLAEKFDQTNGELEKTKAEIAKMAAGMDRMEKLLMGLCQKTSKKDADIGSVARLQQQARVETRVTSSEHAQLGMMNPTNPTKDHSAATSYQAKTIVDSKSVPQSKVTTLPRAPTAFTDHDGAPIAMVPYVQKAVRPDRSLASGHEK